MKNLRQLHLYLGCIFAPMIIYFALSGAWQAFRWNDLPKNESPTRMQSVLHALSMPHTNSTLPGSSPKTDRSPLFAGVSFLMGMSLVITTLLGVVLALRFGRKPRLVVLCLGLGVAIPVALLFLKS